MSRRAGTAQGGAAAQAAAMAAPAWRQFSFFQSSPFPSSSSSPHLDLVQQPALLSTVHANCELGDGIVLAADLEGNLHWLNSEWETERSWTAYDRGRVQLVESAEWDLSRGWTIVVTVGDDASTPFPLLKVWLLTLPPSSSSSSAVELATADASSSTLPTLTLLRQAPISPTPSRPSPISSLALSPSLSHVVLGLADGSVVAFKRVVDLVEASLVDLEDAAARARAASAPGAGSFVRKSAGYTVGGMGKLRVLWEGNKEPVTNLGITADASAAGPSSSSGAGQTLFVLTTSQILALSLDKASKSKLSAGESSSASSSQPALLDELGAAVGCAKVLRLGLGKGVGEFEGETAERMVVARDEAIYVYGKEGREGCWAYEGPKSYIVPLHSASVASPSASSSATSSHLLPTPYLAIVSPPQSSSLSSNSATIRAHAARSSPALGPASSSNGGDEHVAKVTVFDPENKFIAFSGTYSGDESGGAGVRSVVEAWGAVWVLTDAGKLFRLTEQPLETSFSTLFQRNLYTLAISLAHSRGLGGDVIAENYRRYGDHLYGKADYEGAMAAYLKTVGTVQASYVIRKFLDAQRLTHLTSYLQELHSRGLANTDITTLLLNCYTKLADDEALSRFIHSSSSSSTASSSSSSPSHSSDEPPFDLDTAIRVLRQAGYFAHATWLAQRYRAHGAYLRIAIEDSGDCVGALRYVRELARDEGGSGGEGASAARDEARESLARWGGVLLQREPELTTEVLVEVCCGVEKAPAPAREGEGKQGSKDSVSKDRVGALKHGRAASGLPTRGGSAPAKAFDVPDSASVGGASSLDGAPGPFAPTAEPESTSSSSLPSPRSFFAHFVDRPRHFISFLEQVVARRYGKPVDSLVAPSSLTGVDAPLPAPRTLDVDVPRDAAARDEQVVWSTLLELYISAAAAAAGAADERERARLQGMALRLLRCQDQVPYDETQALLVCTTQGFEEGFVLLYELLGMYEDIVRYWIDAATSSPSAPDHTSRIVRAVRRYGPSCPSLYALVLRHLTTSSDILSRHQADLLDLLDEIDRDKVMPPIKVVQLLSANGNASVGLVREYLKRQLLAEKQEFDSDQALIKSYRTETLKKRREIAELSDPTTPRIFQVTRCSACGGQLDLPGVHFMCRHSYHQRCLGENESQCPNCARTHGVVREIRRNNEQLRGRHDVFLDEVRGADDPFAAVAGAFARGWMGERGGGEP